MTVKHKEQAEGQGTVIYEGNQGPATPGTAARCETCGREYCDRSFLVDEGNCDRLYAERLKAENATLEDSYELAVEQRNRFSVMLAAAEQRAEAAEKALRSARAIHPKCVILGTGAEVRCRVCRIIDAALHDEERSAASAAPAASEALSLDDAAGITDVIRGAQGEEK